MAFFNNTDFIHHIVQDQGTQNRIPKQLQPQLLTLVQLETHLLIENAIKFMRRDRRDYLVADDIELACSQMGHPDLVTTPTSHYSNHHNNHQQSHNPPEVPLVSAQEVLEQEMALLAGRPLQSPGLTGRWVLLKGKVPSIAENVGVRRLEQDRGNARLDQEEKRKLCNIIKDNPYSYLNADQSTYFLQVARVVERDLAPKGFPLQGDLTNLMPFILKKLTETPLNETGAALLLRLLDNHYVWRSIEYFASHTLSLLASYQGPQSYEVGVATAQIIDRLSEKYPNLRDFYLGRQDKDYSFLLKGISFEIYLGIPLELDLPLLEQCKRDADLHHPLASVCLSKLKEHAGQLQRLREMLARQGDTFIYWLPSRPLRQDRFLAMF